MSEVVDVAPDAAAATAPAAPVPAEAPVQASQNPADQAPAAEGSDKPEADKTAEQPDPNKGINRLNRKIDRLVRERAEASARAEALQREVERLQPRQEAPKGEPRIDDFQTVAEYAKAYAEWNVHQAKTQWQQEQHARAAAAQHQELARTWETQLKDARKAYEDFDDVVANDDVPLTPVMQQAIMGMPKGADVAYFLGTHPKEAVRISSLPYVLQAAELGMIAAKLEAPKPRASKAPAPISPVSPATPVVSDAPQDTDDIGTWIKKRQKQVHRR